MNRRAFLKNLGALAQLSASRNSPARRLAQLSSFAAHSTRSRAAPAAEQSAQPTFRLTDVTTSAGIHFHHNSGAYGGKLLPETLGSGCAFLDYDNDGWQDILLINGTDWPGHQTRPQHAPPLPK